MRITTIYDEQQWHCGTNINSWVVLLWIQLEYRTKSRVGQESQISPQTRHDLHIYIFINRQVQLTCEAM